MHTRTLLGLLLASALVVSGCATDEPALEGSPPPGGGEPGGEMFTATITELNGSGVSGIAEVRVEEDTQFDITIEAAGLEGAEEHPQHIHGKAEEAASCPTAEADEDGNGFVEIQEGLPDYGTVIVPLAPFPNADENGNVEFEGTFPVGDAAPFADRVLVIHGMTADLGDGEAYQETLPVACGRFEP